VSGVVVIELLPACTATRVLLERALADPKIEIKNGYKIEAIRGTSHVEVVDIIDTKTSTRSRLATDGVLVRIGIQPNTGYFKDLLSMNSKEQIIVDEKMETNFTGIFAAGDVRSNSPCQISSAVGDGATAAISLIEYLEIRR
jgi:thioredoxin reductase (NADPH)